MNLKIIKAGLLDTVQDLGRNGFQHLGINPGGAMDRFSAGLANALVGKNLSSAVIEMHFPASQFLFGAPCIICISGANFTPCINDEEVPVHQPLLVNESSVLSFKKIKHGARCYLSLRNDLELKPWLNSFSTNLKAGAGGFKGRCLANGDEIGYKLFAGSFIDDFIPLPWTYQCPPINFDEIGFIPGPEWNWLTVKSQTDFLNRAFTIARASDRMGFQLQGPELEQENLEQLVSSAVSFGTVQLLPNGQLIILMADHQTTGGYPRIANVISADLSKLAQLPPGQSIKFAMTEISEAEERLVAQQNYLERLQNTCNLKIQTWLDAHRHQL